MSGRPAPTQHPISDVIANRWSSRAIDTRALERDKLKSLLEAARWAPSCFGDEPWRFIVWDRSEDAAAWERAMSTLAGKNQLWARKAPVLLLVLADTLFRQNEKPNRWGEYDTGAAAENLHLQGVALGLVVHQMGGFDPDAAREQFAIPDRYSPMAMVAVGYPGKLEDLDEGFHGGETGERKRRPLAELAFEGRWGQSLT
ncbi:MAG: nitroreductase family protein [Pseudomonadota bacterium]